MLRGPQGTLRGRASPSGSITVTTRKPDLNEMGGFADFTGNTLATMNVSGGLNVPVIPGIAAIRVSGVWDINEGNRVRTSNPSVDGRKPLSETWSGRVIGLVEPTDWLRMYGVNMGNQYRWSRDKKLRAWIEASRLDGFSALADGVQEDEADKIAILERFGQSAGRAVDNIKKLLTPPVAVAA